MVTWHAGRDLGSQSLGFQGALQQDPAGLLQQLLPWLQVDQISVPEPQPQLSQRCRHSIIAFCAAFHYSSPPRGFSSSPKQDDLRRRERSRDTIP